MRTWSVTGETLDETLATVESRPDGRVSVQVHRDPLTPQKAEELRLAIGAAIGDSRTAGSTTGNNASAQPEGGHSQGGESRA